VTTDIKIPGRVRDRLKLVGTTLYGSRWKRPLAVALGTSEQQVHRWYGGQGHQGDLDARLVGVLDEAEMNAAGLRRKLSRFVTTQTARQRRRLERDRRCND
jgi:hypothetical protein